MFEAQAPEVVEGSLPAKHTPLTSITSIWNF